MKNAAVIVHLQRAAPPKPPEGAPCNGCGVCCALETCPVARLRFLRRDGPCPALEWDGEEALYRCGLLRHPAVYFPLLPRRLSVWLGRRMARWIAAGQGCDCSAEVLGEPPGA